MTTVSALRTQVTALRKLANRVHEPRHWSLVLEDGFGIPDKVRQQFRETDEIYIRHTPKGYEGGDDNGDYCIGHVTSSAGTFVVYPDGRLEPVKQDAAGRRRR